MNDETIETQKRINLSHVTTRDFMTGFVISGIMANPEMLSQDINWDNKAIVETVDKLVDVLMDSRARRIKNYKNEFYKRKETKHVSPPFPPKEDLKQQEQAEANETRKQ